MSRKIIYHNYTVLSPNGIEMFRCDKKKFDWYLKKNLATQVKEETIRLLFEPQGLGWSGSHFYLQDRDNKCSVCGSLEDLSRHHVVPYCYRKYMPDEVKNNNYYDVLPVCLECHRVYEKLAAEKKEELAKRYNAPIEGIDDEKRNEINSLARTIIKCSSYIPEKRKQEILQKIAKHFNKESLSEKDLLEMQDLFKKKISFKCHAEIVVSSLSCLSDFVEEWRGHFVSIMNPKYLPKNWSIDRDLHGRIL